MVKRFLPFYLFTFILFLTSCNLFIEEEEIADDYGYTNLPEYSGEGYDEPVTTTQGDCEVTYQLKKTVRQLDEENTRYITSVKQDNSGLLLEIHYSAQTPSDQLPQRGQVLVCTDTDVKNETGKSERKQLEVDFVCNQDDRRIYIQSALVMDTKDKEDQELASLRKIDDSFQKVVIVGGMQPTYRNDEGILILNVYDFLLGKAEIL